MSLHEYLDGVKGVLNQHASIINSIKKSNDDKVDESDLGRILKQVSTMVTNMFEVNDLKETVEIPHKPLRILKSYHQTE